jgi:uncharacterized protein (TIGR03435 family)
MRAALLLAIAALVLTAQTFEVTSVKVNTSGSGSSGAPWLAKGRLTATNTTMRQMLESAWGLSSPQINGPAWIDTDRYDLEAKSPEGVADTEIKPMLQTLLKERFGLVAHIESKEMAVYNLVPTKDGPKIKPTDPDHPPTQPARMPGTCCMVIAYRGLLDDFAHGMSDIVGRTVINKTGLEGPHSWALQWAKVDSAADLNGAPDIFGAIQQQLGLKLESAKADVPTLVIDHAERVPTGN